MSLCFDQGYSGSALPSSRSCDFTLSTQHAIVGVSFQSLGKQQYSPMSDEQSLTHLDSKGEAHMVDVGDKAVTQRIATARSKIKMQPETLAAIESSELKKGDALATARIAAIQAAKKTSDLIPLCHPLPITKVSVDLTIDHDLPGVVIDVTCKVRGQTGIEMEALTAASVAALTLYDMAKGIDRGMVIEQIALMHKSGGKTGEWQNDDYR